ncbi:MAG: hypothetical protein IJF40_04610 [Clostridia bacterium]|nr:hypothetical protein [Clostridia bacterium]
MTLEKAFFILRHGSAEGNHKYFEAISVIENEYNRQKAEIERLEADNEYLQNKVFKVAHEVRAEVVKEFAERLDTHFEGSGIHWLYEASLKQRIDNLVKEMVGDAE